MRAADKRGQANLARQARWLHGDIYVLTISLVYTAVGSARLMHLEISSRVREARRHQRNEQRQLAAAPGNMQQAADLGSSLGAPWPQLDTTDDAAGTQQPQDQHDASIEGLPAHWVAPSLGPSSAEAPPSPGITVLIHSIDSDNGGGAAGFQY